MKRTLRGASRAPEARRRQSISRRRRPPKYRRACRAPQPWPACAKSASKKLSSASTTARETRASVILLRAPSHVNIDVVLCAPTAGTAAVGHSGGGSPHSDQSSLFGGMRPGTLRVSSGRGAPVAVCRGRLLGAHPRPGRGGPGAHVSRDRPFRAEGACAGGDAGSGAAFVPVLKRVHVRRSLGCNSTTTASQNTL